MPKKRNNKRPKLLSHTRPTGVQKPRTVSSHASRSLIRNHHALQKQLCSALAKKDTSAAASIESQLSAAGGLPKYQQASIQGQSLERGGDASKVLVEWLSEDRPSADLSRDVSATRRLRMLEVGALRVDNACSRSGLFDMTRIDLHSQHPDIETQDFMQRPIPSPIQIQTEGFDVVSLSLVVNYVGNAVGRGDMLRRVSLFLRSKSRDAKDVEGPFPVLFLVLPAPCVLNSRYLDEDRLEEIMLSLGYSKARRKLSAKLVYYLWRYVDRLEPEKEKKRFKKEQVRTGGSRNNFAIVLT